MAQYHTLEQHPEKVLSSLLGGEEQIAKLQDFISLPGMFALSRHAYESLFHPPTLNTDSSDPQSLQINSEIKAHLKDANKIRVLDYGVGRGRLFSNIIENNKEPLEDLIKWFDYVAYDKFDKDKEECLAKLQSVYPDHNDRYFNSFSELLAKKDKGTFDVVVMCNVLHEIDPKEWLNLFGKDGQITSLLSDNGILLLVEDQEMPIGEKAYQKGFIVLDTQDLKQLFKITEADTDFGFSDARGDSRLKAHRIKKEYLERITAASRVEALRSINKTAKEKIIDVRERAIDYKNGKRHGFWIQQFANTQLAIEELAN